MRSVRVCLLLAALFLGAFSPCALSASCAGAPSPKAGGDAAPQQAERRGSARPTVDVRVGSWNIERFDAAGPDDRTYPTRTRRHLGLIAQAILDEGIDLLGLQEVIGPGSPGAPYSLRQLVDELNGRSRSGKGRGKENSPKIWKAVAGGPHGPESHLALVWNSEKLELVGKPRELTELARGYGGNRVSSKGERRFPRPPLVARFRVSGAPENDFMVVVLHLKASSTGLYGGLDTNDKRRLGEWEDLLRKWLLNPRAQGELRDTEIIVLGDMNETAGNSVQLLDEYGTGDDVKGRLILDPSDFSLPESLLLFTSAVLDFPRHFTYEGNAEKGQRKGDGFRRADILSGYRNFVDHILISRPLLDNWDGKFAICYFETRYPLEDHVHISDHRPVSIRLSFPAARTREAEGASR